MVFLLVRFVAFLMVSAVVSAADPRALSLFSAITVRNGAADGFGIAPGSFMAVGALGLLGFEVPTTTFRLTTSDGATVPLPVIVPPSSVNGSGTILLWTLLPANSPLGPARLEATTRGLSYTADFELVRSAPAIYTRDYTGLGPALALNNAARTMNALTAAAVPSGEIALFATGLGDIRTQDVTVEIAGASVPATFAGPQGQYPGLDQINFRLPDNPSLGCYVPILVRARGVPLNTVTISINTDRFACAHPLGLSYGDLQQLDAGAKINLAYFTVYGNYTIPVAPSESASFGFYNADASLVAYLAGAQMPDERYLSCAPLQTPASIPGPGQTVNAGDMTIAGPAGTLTLKAQLYSQAFPSLVPVFGPGSWQISAPGGPDVFGFTLPFRLPPLFGAAAGKLDDAGLLVTWNADGYLPSDTVTIYLSSLSRPGAIACSGRASEGRLRVSASIIGSLQPLRRDLSLVMHIAPAARPHFELPRRSGPPIPGVLDYQFSLNLQNAIQ